MPGPAFHVRAIALLALAFACAWSFAGCGGGDDGGSDEPKTVASSGQDGSPADAGSTTTQSGSGDRSRSGGSGEAASDPGQGSTSGSASAGLPAQPGQEPGSFGHALRNPKKPKQPHKAHSGESGKAGGGPTAGLSPQQAATYEAARALCANPDSLQYAPEEIRDDAEALAEFAEGFAPSGEEQIVHDGCLAGLKSIGID